MSDKSANSPAEDPAADEHGAEGGRLPEGMRVVRKRRKRKSASRQTLFLKKREILRGMHDDTSAVGVKEQVERLKSAQKAKQENRPLEEHWGGPATSHKGARWFLLRLFAITIPVLAIVTAFLLTRGEKGHELTQHDFDPQLDLGKTVETRPPYDPTGPIAWFNDNPHEAYESAVAILDELNALDENQSPHNVLRDEGTALTRIGKWGLGWESDFQTDDPRKLFWSTGQSGETGYVILEGRRKNHEKFRAYFVKTRDGLRLDWEATTGWCEVPFDELIESSPSGPVLVRGSLVKEAHFDVKDSLYSWYLLRNADDSNHLWAHVPVNGELDQKLRDLFRFGWWVSERVDEVRLTLRVSKSQFGFRANEFRIEELVTEEWVIPE